MYMGFGTIAAQLINVLVQPILTRIVPTETLGIYTYVVSLATIIIPIASLKLDMLVVTEEDEQEAQYITDACGILNFIVALGYALVLLVGYFLPGENVFNKYGAVVFWVPLLVLTNGLRFLFISYSNRYKQYGLISGMGILRETSRAVIQVLSGLCGFGVAGQTLGYGVAPLLGLNIQAKEYLTKKHKRAALTPGHFKDICLHKGRRQVLFMVPAQFVNSFSASLVTMSIMALYSAAELGYYSVGVRILEIPIIFITANVSKVFYRKVSESVQAGEGILSLFVKVIAVLGVVSAGGFWVLYLIAPWLSELFFGAGYAVAGEYIKVLCLMYAVRLVVASFSGVYTVFGKQSLELFFNVLLVGFGLAAAVVSKYLALTIEGYLTLIGAGYALTYGGMLAGYLILCARHDRRVKSRI